MRSPLKSGSKKPAVSAGFFVSDAIFVERYSQDVSRFHDIVIFTAYIDSYP